jgi:hypothetical protein
MRRGKARSPRLTVSRIRAGRPGFGGAGSSIGRSASSTDLDEPQSRHCVEHRLEQAAGDLLRVGEIQPVKPHELRVAGDVREEQQRAIRHL